ncbi:MAG: Planctomycete cytochrome [Armatimonadetes bacterium]|nr:Planctomycete cytochrome [Armatimonadota bacterium]
MPRRTFRIPSLLVLTVAGVPAAALAAALAPAPAVADRELPAAAAELLGRRCLQCHGAQKLSGLDLRTREAALHGGGRGTPLIAGKPEESLLYRVISGQAEPKMPPGKPLPPAEQALLRRWIASGAAWPAKTGPEEVHWSYRPIQRPALPQVKNRDWPRNPIDAFVLAKLEVKGLSPAPPADPRTLIRRVYFDLTGLPPTPDEVEAFVRECEREAAAPPTPKAQHPTLGAYERLVDRLLASPRYGERWARHWLDVARFAESQGFERDKVRENAWRYRDWVIRALNQDLPYNRFMQWQVAGDVLPDATRESVTATGFLVAGPWDEVGNLQVSELMKARVREDELEDIVSAVGQTFLGLTVNCARCHDHKFDPIPQKDYYRLAAVFAGVRHGDRSILPPAEKTAHEAEVAALEKRETELTAEAGKLDGEGRQRVLAARAGGSATVTAAGPAPVLRWDFEAGTRDLARGIELRLTGGAAVAGGRLRLPGKEARAQSDPLPFPVTAKTLEAWVSLKDLTQRGGSVLTLETDGGGVFDGLVFGERQPKKWMAGSNGFVRTRDLTGPEETSDPVKLVHVAAVYGPDHRVTVFRNGQPYGEGYVPGTEGASALQTFAGGKGHLLFGQRHTGAGGDAWLNGEIEEARVYTQALTPAEVLASFNAGPANVRPEELLAALSPAERERRKTLDTELSTLREQIRTLRVQPQAYAANPKEPPAVFLLERGDVQKKGEKLAPAGLSVISSLPAQLEGADVPTEGVRRVKFAEWLADARNPLPARVMVNRVWQYHFGRGLAGSPSDFGANGEAPTHPELLDYLAATFVSGNEEMGKRGNADPISPSPRSPISPARRWSLKALHRLIVTSNTYRQGGRLDPRAAAVDSENTLLWRQAPRRLEAEELRDTLLAVSGQLNLQEGGPGFKLFNVLVSNSSFYTFEDKVGPEFNRRSIYRTVVNSGGVPLLDAFDCPDPSVKAPRRGTTTTPLQALALMNNSFVLRQSRELAALLEKEAPVNRPRQLELAYQRAFGRPPTPAERARAAVFVSAHGLPAFCRALLNASELIYVR